MSSISFYLFIFYLYHEYWDDSILHPIKQRICIVSCLYTTQAALKALQAAKTSPLAQKCQKALNNISTRHRVGLYWVPGHAGLRGNEIADRLTRDGSVQKFGGTDIDKMLDGKPAFGNVAWSL
jgi:hypothetical protein